MEKHESCLSVRWLCNLRSTTRIAWSRSSKFGGSVAEAVARNQAQLEVDRRCQPHAIARLKLSHGHAVAGEELIIDPGVRALHAVAQARAGLPVEVAADERVVAIAAVDAPGGVELVATLKPNAGDLFDHVDQAVDRHQLVGSEVDGLLDRAVQDAVDAMKAIVDIHEAAGLLAVAPDLNFVIAGELGLDHLAADGGRRLLAATLPRAVRTVDVMETGHPRHQTKILAEMAA